MPGVLKCNEKCSVFGFCLIELLCIRFLFFKVGDVLPVIRLDGDKLIKLCSLDCLVDFKRRRKLDFSPCECCGLFINTTDFL